MNGNEQMNIMINERDEQHHYWTLTCDDDGMNVNNSNGDMAQSLFLSLLSALCQQIHKVN